MSHTHWETLPKETIREFDEKGCVIVRNALNKKTVAHLLEVCDRIINSNLKTNRQTRENGYYDGFRNCIALDDAFLPLLIHDKIFPMVVQFLGAYIHLTTSHLIYKHPDPPGTPDYARAPNWHRDYGRLNQDLQHAAPRGMLKCAYYLTELNEPNSGATLVVPGSNLLRDPLNIPQNADPEGTLEPQLEPGDCLIFENRTWHSGGVNLSNQTRKVIMFGYGYRWLAPIDYRIQPEATVEKLDTLGKYLVGEHLIETEEYQTSGGETPLRPWCEENDLPLVRPPIWHKILAIA